MKVMSCNAGSSSLKFKLYNMPSEEVICKGMFERIGQEMGNFELEYNDKEIEREAKFENHSVAVSYLLDSLVSEGIVSSLEEIGGVGHRVVHGGEKFAESIKIDEEVIKAIEEVSDLAPLHNPANLIGIHAFIEVLPHAGQVAVFDTAFHQTMEPETYIYAVPYEWYEDYGVRKYGFHGTSHKYVSLKAAELEGKRPEDVNVIVCHLGNGASICAVKGGKSINTTMGLTPLAGIPMGTRSGNIDPAIIEFISEKENKTVQEVTRMLNKKSGFLGVSGISSDNRDLEAAVAKGNRRAQLAMDIQDKKITDIVAAYYVYMGGCDVIAFTAGLGENSARMRKSICDRLSALGVKIDLERNNVRKKTTLISSDDSSVAVYLIPTDEEIMLARDTFELI
ncbi:acetate kinase [Mycoplasmatota bacterium]|nr:acetate kinase [Mycoplasmatota bacterium]